VLILIGLGVDRHDCFVDALFGGQVSEGFVLCNVLVRATGLVVEFGIFACGAGVPDGNVVAARETVVVVVEVFVAVGWRGAAVGGWCGSGSGYGHDDWCRHGRDDRSKRKSNSHG